MIVKPIGLSRLLLQIFLIHIIYSIKAYVCPINCNRCICTLIPNPLEEEYVCTCKNPQARTMCYHNYKNYHLLCTEQFTLHNIPIIGEYIINYSLLEKSIDTTTWYKLYNYSPHNYIILTNYIDNILYKLNSTYLTHINTILNDSRLHVLVNNEPKEQRVWKTKYLNITYNYIEYTNCSCNEYWYIYNDLTIYDTSKVIVGYFIVEHDIYLKNCTIIGSIISLKGTIYIYENVTISKCKCNIPINLPTEVPIASSIPVAVSRLGDVIAVAIYFAIVFTITFCTCCFILICKKLSKEDTEDE